MASGLATRVTCPTRVGALACTCVAAVALALWLAVAPVTTWASESDGAGQAGAVMGQAMAALQGSSAQGDPAEAVSVAVAQASDPGSAGGTGSGAGAGTGATVGGSGTSAGTTGSLAAGAGTGATAGGTSAGSSASAASSAGSASDSAGASGSSGTSGASDSSSSSYDAMMRMFALQRLLVPAAPIALFVLLVAGAVVAWRMRLRSPRASFAGKYLRDVPTPDHPSVLGYLWHDGILRNGDLSAAIVRLGTLGVVRVERAVSQRASGWRGKTSTVYDSRLTLRPDADLAMLGPIDQATVDLLFGTSYAAATGGQSAGDPANWDVASWPEGAASFLFSAFPALAKAHAKGFYRRHREWEARVLRVAERRDFFDDASGARAGSIRNVGSVMVALGMFLFFLPFPLGMLFPSMLTLQLSPIVSPFGVALFFGGFAWRTVGRSRRRRTRAGSELYARLVALRNWLRDFTRLREAIPADVILWDRLLVMAVALGVARQVARQLQVALPQLAADVDAGGCAAMGWYVGPDGGSDAAGELDTMMDDARSEAWDELDASDVADVDGDYDDMGSDFSGGFGDGFGGGDSDSGSDGGDSDGGDGGDGGGD